MPATVDLPAPGGPATTQAVALVTTPATLPPALRQRSGRCRFAGQAKAGIGWREWGTVRRVGAAAGHDKGAVGWGAPLKLTAMALFWTRPRGSCCRRRTTPVSHLTALAWTSSTERTRTR